MSGSEQIHKAGDTVYLIERDEGGEPVDFSGYMFLSAVGNAVIVSSFIDDIKTLEDTLNVHINDTANEEYVNLHVFPKDDCYSTMAEAEAIIFS